MQTRLNLLGQSRLSNPLRFIVPLLLLALVCHSRAANVVVDSAKTWLGFMNVYTNVGGNAGALDFGSPWGTADLPATFTNQTLLLAPNTNIDRDNPTDPFWWVGGADGAAAHIMEANFYVEDDTLAGQTVVFSGYCPSNTLDSAYTSVAFIKDFAADYSSFVVTSAALVAGQPFSIELATAAGHHIQYGFSTIGPNAREEDAPSLGQVTIDPNVLVVTSAADSGPGSLRDIIASASSGQTIVFANSLSGQTITLTSGQLYVDKNLIIDASMLDNGLTIDGNGTVTSNRVFEIAASTTDVSLESLSIVNGFNTIGGGIYSEGALNMRNCTLSNNSATFFTPSGRHGGAIYSAGMLTLQECAVINNYAYRGGSLFNDGIMIINSSSLSGSRAADGAGIYNSSSGTLTINSSSITDCGGTGFLGGGVLNQDGTVTINNSTISGNDANKGGGCYNAGSSAWLVLNNSTVVDNLGSIGGGIANEGTLMLTNSIVANNVATTGPNIHGVLDSEVNSITSGDPLLASLGFYGGPTQTMPPLPGSPAIDGGLTSATNSLTDQRGMTRVLSAGYGAAVVDIGAVEWNGWLVGQDVSGFDPAYLLPGSIYDGTTVFPGGFNPLAAGMLEILSPSDKNGLIAGGVTQGEGNVTGDPESYGLYNESAFQALALDRPFLTYNAVSNSFTLTIGVLQTPDLVGTLFTNLTGFTTTAYPGDGEIDIEFTPPNSDARFFEVYGTEPNP